MAWIDDEQWERWWEPGDAGLNTGLHDTALHAGRTLYWLATIIAALIVVFALADFFISWAQGQPVVRVVAFISAVVVWLIGRVCRALLS
jgi:hypothetical protein